MHVYMLIFDCYRRVEQYRYRHIANIQLVFAISCGIYFILLGK